MTTTISTTIPLDCVPGVEPLTDSTNYATEHWTDSQNIRFVKGRPEKIGGWNEQRFDNGTISGVPRSIFSTAFGNRVQTVIGTHTKVYGVSGSILTNITPLQNTPIAAPNSLSTLYGTLANNPISTTNGSNVIRISDTSVGRLKVGDSIQLSGAADTGGILAANINGTRLIRAVGVNYYEVNAGAIASSTITGGGASVIRSTGIINVSSTAHGNIDGDRVQIGGVSIQTAASATVVNAGSGYSINDQLTVVGGSGTPAVFVVQTEKVVSSTVATAGTGYVPGGTLTASGGTFTTAATWTLATTKAVSATIANAGASGGANGTYTFTGTTGTGTKFQFSGTVAGGILTSILSITNGGAYTVNPTVLANETVSGGGFTGSPPRVSVVMGANTVTVANGGDYSVLAANPISITGGSGTGATLNAVWGVSSVSLLIAGEYSISPVNPVSTTSGVGTGATLTVTYGGDGTVGGITQAEVNGQFMVRNSLTNSFDVMTSGFATSSVSASGGSAVFYYEEVTSGQINEVAGQGYGMGMYGEGLYGTALLSQSGRVFPRIWFMDKYSDSVILNAGNNTPVYAWDGSQTNAPARVQNAPDDVNYAFISDNILVTFGAGLVPNKIFSSDQANITNWTASSTNFVYEKNLEGAGRLLSHANINGTNLIWTEQRAYTMRFVGLPNVWAIKPLEAIGIISPMARVAVNGKIVWMGLDNFYMWRGGAVEIVPANSGPQSTLLRNVFDNLNLSQKSKCFAWYNKKFNEIWFHYPTEDSLEPNRVACVSVKDFTWFPLNMERTAAEYPEINLSVPRLGTFGGDILRHETGTDDIDSPLPFSITSNRKKLDKKVTSITAIIPDSNQTGDIQVNSSAWKYHQSKNKTVNKTNIVSPNTETVQLEAAGKDHQHTISGSVLGQSWAMGSWELEVNTRGSN